ncbi:hypothetical protein ACFPRL_01440 [Pseudoclavibacter helvolus]
MRRHTGCAGSRAGSSRPIRARRPRSPRCEHSATCPRSRGGSSPHRQAERMRAVLLREPDGGGP